MNNDPITVIFLGRSGCGKGTQAGLLVEYLQKHDTKNPVYHLESGAKFRDFIAQDGYVPSLAKKCYETGKLQPEFLAIWAWADLLVKNVSEKHHLIIDGAARRLHEATLLHDALQFLHRKNMFFVFLDVSREWSKDRMLARKRQDDTLHDIQMRLDWYDAKVLPVVDYFENNPAYTFLRIDGEQSIDAVHADVMKGISWLA